MLEAAILRRKGERLKNSLQATISNFRGCNDHFAVDNLLGSIDDLEDIIDYYRLAEGAAEDIAILLPVLRQMRTLLENKDAIGATDTLEFRLLTLVAAWIARCGLK